MPTAKPIRLAVLAATIIGLGACSETTFRRSTLHHVQLDGREISVSWIRMQPEEVEVVAWEAKTFEWVQSPATQRLDRVTAARAAETVVDQLCWHGFTVAPTPGTYAEGHHAFRYRCLPAQ
ncbi:hypothetical protein MTBLM5_230007 [Magnetospirillum sp. LM-5]|uniref:hypothetical protein n=1 Tax=Magnetospirillum sp. LM-5 TaxID=2681466 RepID=UPI0013858FFC|nr:hypothetical protein [Magnetospirillum sp. LM-5]CAA7617752.1 hypothetical protein MTBLM5_230007 [Magnetospirillum sp. LM-5]